MTKRFALIYSLPAVAGTLYGGGLLTQLFVNYRVWSSAGGMPGDGTTPKLPSLSLVDCLRANFILPDCLIGISICALLFFLLFAVVMKLGSSESGDFDAERNLEISKKGTYGTAGFMDRAEVESLLEIGSIEECKGLILGEMDGQIVSLPDDTYFNKNIAVYGSSGSMKSRTVIRNMALQLIRLGQSFICTDPKGELIKDLLEYAKSQSYTTRILNLVHLENSDGWNCLKEVGGSEIMAQVFCDVVMKNTGSGRGDPFWDNGETNLLKALVLYVDQGPESTNKNFSEVMRLIMTKDETALNKVFNLLPLSHPAKAPYNIFQQASDTVRQGIIIGLGTRLQVMQNKLIQEITSHDDIDLTLPGKRKCAYFIVTSDQDSTFDFVASLFFSFLFIKLVRFADEFGKDGKLPVPVTIIGDEWANAAGTVVDLQKKISTIRSRALSLVCCFQNLPQLQNRYPDNQWQEILGNCDTTIFLGCTDPLTAQFVCDRTGEASISVNSKSKQLGTWRISNYAPEYRETSSVGKRKLLTMDEIMRLPMNQELVFLRGQKVLKLQKVDYTRHPDAKKLVRCNPSEHIPEWRRQLTTDETTTVDSVVSPVSNQAISNSKRAVKLSKAVIPSHTEREHPVLQDQPSVTQVSKDSILSP